MKPDEIWSVKPERRMVKHSQVVCSLKDQIQESLNEAAGRTAFQIDKLTREEISKQKKQVKGKKEVSQVDIGISTSPETLVAFAFQMISEQERQYNRHGAMASGRCHAMDDLSKGRALLKFMDKRAYPQKNRSY